MWGAANGCRALSHARGSDFDTAAAVLPHSMRHQLVVGVVLQPGVMRQHVTNCYSLLVGQAGLIGQHPAQGEHMWCDVVRCSGWIRPF